MSQPIQPFIALEPPFSWLAALKNAQALLRGRFDHLHWKTAEYFHLSLLSLKYRERGRITQIVEALDHAAADCEPFELHIGSLRLFGRERDPHTLCADVRGDVQELDDLRRAIHRALVPLGFRTAKNSYTPHITLATRSDAPHDDAIGRLRRAIVSTVVPPTEPFTVGRVILIHPTVEGDHARHERVASAMVGIMERGC